MAIAAIATEDRDVPPWDAQAGPPSIHLNVNFAIPTDPAAVSLFTVPSGRGDVAEYLAIEGEGFSRVVLGLGGGGWPSDEDQILVAGRLINLLREAQERARNRITIRAHVHDFRQADEAQFCATCGQERR